MNDKCARMWARVSFKDVLLKMPLVRPKRNRSRPIFPLHRRGNRPWNFHITQLNHTAYLWPPRSPSPSVDLPRKEFGMR